MTHHPHHRREIRHVEDESPPVLGTWSRVYTFVLIELAAVIALCYWFTVALKP